MTTAPPGSWYDDLTRMATDDAVLQHTYRRLRADLTPEARRLTDTVHVYPSRRCSYTIGKERVFVKVRDDAGALLPECVLRHVLLHELAHTVNAAQGHGHGFRGWLHWLRRNGAVASCGERVPRDFNPCRDSG
jgi:hypothetical protein